MQSIRTAFAQMECSLTTYTTYSQRIRIYGMLAKKENEVANAANLLSILISKDDVEKKKKKKTPIMHHV